MLQVISGIRVKDALTKKNMFENDNLGQIYVLQRQPIAAWILEQVAWDGLK